MFVHTFTGATSAPLPITTNRSSSSTLNTQPVSRTGAHQEGPERLTYPVSVPELRAEVSGADHWSPWLQDVPTTEVVALF